MNRRKTLISLLIAGLMTASSFAATRGSLVLHSPVMVGATQLPEGEYRLYWDGDGPEVELTIKKDNRAKTTVPAKFLPVNKTFREDAIVVSTDGDGRRKLTEIRLSGKNFCIEIESQPRENAEREKSSR